MRAALAVAVSLSLLLAPVLARATDEDPTPPGTRIVVGPGNVVERAGFYLDADRLTWYEAALLDRAALRIEVNRLTAQLTAAVEVDVAGSRYTAQLEARVRQLEHPTRAPALWLAAGLVCGLALAYLSALAWGRIAP